MEATLRAARACVLPALLALVLLVPGGCDTEGAAAVRHEGGPGYPCYFDQDCAAPLLCDDAPGARFPVCTGSSGEGEPCGHGVACAWIRDDRGLPLACAPDGTCQFPPSESVPAESVP